MPYIRRTAFGPSRVQTVSKVLGETRGSFYAPLNKRQKRTVKRLIHNVEELKYFILNTSGTTGAYGIASFSDVPQGDTDITRDGDRLQWRQIKMRCTMGPPGLADTAANIRLIMLQWKPNTVPTVPEILLNGPSGGADSESHYNHDLRQQYHIFYDKVFKLTGSGSAATDPLTSLSKMITKVTVSMKRLNKNVQFSGGSTTGTNKFYYILGSDSAVAPHPGYSISFKTFFTDS